MTGIGFHRDWQVFKMDSFSCGFFHRLFVSMLHARPCICLLSDPSLHSSCCVFQQHWFLSVWPVADTERKMQGKGEARVLLVSLRPRRTLQQWLGFLSSSAPTEESHCDPSFFPGVPDHEFQEPHLSLYPLTSGCSDFLSHPSLDSLSIPYLVLSSSVISITNSLQ